MIMSCRRAHDPVLVCWSIAIVSVENPIPFLLEPPVVWRLVTASNTETHSCGVNAPVTIDKSSGEALIAKREPQHEHNVPISQTYWLCEEIKHAVEHCLRIWSDDVATFRDTPCNGIA